MKHIHKLAFCGKMGSGKTTATLVAAGILQYHHGISLDNPNAVVIKFANPLYTSLAAFHQTEKNREFLQRLGDLGRRCFGDDIMNRIFRENVEGFIENKLPTIPNDHALIMTDDLRFVGEYKVVKDLGFTVIRIEASEEVRKERLGVTFLNTNHRSEIEQDMFDPDYIIMNEGNTEEFKQALGKLLVEKQLIGV